MVTEVKDYVGKIQERYPFLTTAEINKIITWGLRKYVWVNKYHADVLICNRKHEISTIHTGPLGKDHLKHYYRFLTKQRMRERALFHLKKLKWDGYYYLGFRQKDHDALMKVWKKGKYVTLHNVYPTKLKSELNHLPYIKHIWRIPFIDDLGWRFFREKIRTNQLEYIGESLYEKYHQCFLKRNVDGPTSVSDGREDVHGSTECDVTDK